MGMLKPAVNKMAFAKVGLYGNAGSGKTHTAALLAIGLWQHAKCKRPVAMFDTEPAASFIIPLFEKAKIPFLVYDESRALKDLMAFMDEAERECDIVIIDSITHVWRDAQESYLKRINEGRKKRRKDPIYSLEFQHWKPIKAAWARFTDRFLSCKMHAIVCGRAGAIYEYQEKDDGSGKKELITTGSRMATEKELGYEPSLLIELSIHREGGRHTNRAIIQKDRTDTINGHEIDAPNFEKLRSHFERLNLGGEHFGSMEQRDSSELFDEEGQDTWAREQRERKIFAEEFFGLLNAAHPGQTAAEKKARDDLLFAVFNTRSKTQVEEATSSERLKAGLVELRELLQSAGKMPAETNAPATEDIPQ